MGPVVVSSLLHILVQHVLLPLERQMLTARPGFEPQACPAPTRPGIYLFSVIDDTMQVRCTIAESLSPRCLCCRACLVALQPARLCLLHALNSPQLTLTSPVDTCPLDEKRGTRWKNAKTQSGLNTKFQFVRSVRTFVCMSMCRACEAASVCVCVSSVVSDAILRDFGLFEHRGPSP